MVLSTSSQVKIMTTNVKPSELNFDKYSRQKYDTDIINVIPGHRQMHETIKEIVGKYFEGKKIRVLELGIGSGLTSEVVLNEVNASEFVGIDFSRNMLNSAADRLKGKNVRLIQGDFSLMELGKDFELVVSVIAIHHQKTNDDKKTLFEKIFNSLAKGGLFVFGDLATYKDKRESAFNDALHFKHLADNATDEETLKDWAFHHKYLNSLAPLEDQIAWLEEVGFKDVEVVFRKFNTSLLIARKS